MPLSEPFWWYHPKKRLVARLFVPFSWAYGAIARRRIDRARPFTSRLPVVCVGNFTAGGTGKTPFCLLLAEILRSMGERPAFLTRGYGGNTAGQHIVDGERDTAELTGDEPLLLASAAPTVISRDRAAGAQVIESLPAQPTVIVMDDGLQNPSLAKTMKIVLIDNERRVGNGMVIPAGPLRAPLPTQMQITDAVILNGGMTDSAEDMPVDEHFADTRQWLNQLGFVKPVFQAWLFPSHPLQIAPNARVIAYAGIANPERFFRTLEQFGLTLVETMPFRDHHAYSAADAENLIAMAAERKAILMTTTKDFARLQGHRDRRAELAEKSVVFPISMTIAPADREELKGLLRQALSSDDLTVL